MDPRKVAASDNDTDLADDFGNEERILEGAGRQSDIVKIFLSEEQFASPSELFPVESPASPPPRRSAVLDIGELPILRGAARPAAAPAQVAVPRTRVRQRHSLARAARLVAIITIAMALIVAGAVALMNRVDVPNLLDDLALNQTTAPAVIEVRHPDEAVHDAASVAAPAPKVDSPPAVTTPVPEVKAVTSKSPLQVQQEKQKPTPKIAANAVTRSSGRQGSPPRPARTPAAPPRTARAGVPAPPGNVAATTAKAQRDEEFASSRAEPPRPAPSTPPSRQTAEASSSLASTAGSAAPAVPAGSSASVAPVTNSASAVAVTNSAAAAPGANSAQPALASSATPALAANAAPPAVNRAPIAAAPPSPGLTTDTRAVAMTLNRYQQAFSALDASAAHAVWPNVDVKALVKAFDQLEEQTFELEGCNISVAGARAEADCAGNARYIRKVGNRALRVEPRHWHFRLRQTGDQWIIDAVDAR
jgi:hypothetical protein